LTARIITSHVLQWHCFRILGSTSALLLALAAVSHADQLEFLNGTTLEGTVTSIRKADKELDFESQIGQQTLTRTYRYNKVRAVTMNGNRYVLNKIPNAAKRSVSAGAKRIRSRREIETLIKHLGSTAPDWWDATPLDYPKTLDLTWPLQPPQEGWHNQKNMGQYLWDIVYPNSDKWRSGLRLVHHTMKLHARNPALLQRDIATIGSMYFRLLQDYPRAAFWLRRAGVKQGDPDAVMLGECYWRMGNKRMALEMLSSPRLPLAAIKLFGDLGETRRAVQLAHAFAKIGHPHEAYLLAGDASRQAGQYQRAIEFYQMVLDSSEARNKDYTARYRGRATDSIAAIRLFDQADVSRVADGSYKASSVAYVGNLEVEVTVKSGRIESVDVTRHKEKQFYAALIDTPRQIVEKQSVKGIDATSRATITSQAIVNATAKALAQGTAEE
jgi:uncharacterized protein with FMN-binding domain